MKGIYMKKMVKMSTVALLASAITCGNSSMLLAKEAVLAQENEILPAIVEQKEGQEIRAIKQEETIDALFENCK